MNNVISCPAAIGQSWKSPHGERLYLHREEGHAMISTLEEGELSYFSPGV